MPPPQGQTIDPSVLCGKLTTHDPDTYIVVCLRCLHYFRSLTELHRHRLLNHSIADNVPTGETLPRISKDGSWLVAGGDNEPRSPIMSTPPALTPSLSMRAPSELPTPSPPPPTIHDARFRSPGPHHQMQTPQHYGYNMPPAANRPGQWMYPPYPAGPHHPQNPYFMGSNHGSPIPSPGPQIRPSHAGQTPTTFSPAAREFVPSGLMSRMSLSEGLQTSPSPPHSQTSNSLH